MSELQGGANSTDWRIDARLAPRWVDLDRSVVIQRYNRLARVLPVFDWLFFQPPAFRREAVARLKLRPGDRVLEIGCGTGLNLPHLQVAVGPTGKVYGVDFCNGMLRKAKTLAKDRGWTNVELVEAEASDYFAPTPLDGVLFGLSYNTMPNHVAVLHHAWDQLKSGGRLVIMDSKLPPGLGGRLLVPFSLWLMKRTMLSNPLIRPWEDLAKLAPRVEMEEFTFGSHYYCRGIKP